jgi:hypothetical protein
MWLGFYYRAEPRPTFFQAVSITQKVNPKLTPKEDPESDPKSDPENGGPACRITFPQLDLQGSGFATESW